MSPPQAADVLVVSPQDFPQVGAIKKRAGHEFSVLSTTLYRLSRAWSVVSCSTSVKTTDVNFFCEITDLASKGALG